MDAAALWPLSRTARIRCELAIRRELRSGPHCAARRHSVAEPLLQARRSGLSAPSVWRGLSAARRCSSPRSVRVGGVARAAQMRARDWEVHPASCCYYWQEKERGVQDTHSSTQHPCRVWTVAVILPPLPCGFGTLFALFFFPAHSLGGRRSGCCMLSVFYLYKRTHIIGTMKDVRHRLARGANPHAASEKGGLHLSHTSSHMQPRHPGRPSDPTHTATAARAQHATTRFGTG